MSQRQSPGSRKVELTPDCDTEYDKPAAAGKAPSSSLYNAGTLTSFFGNDRVDSVLIETWTGCGFFFLNKPRSMSSTDSKVD